MSASPSTAPARLQSLDQFRGYTVAGMWLVNFMGGYAICPPIWKHTHNYCSYADTIMPQFLFAAGFAMRLSFLKHLEHGGAKEAWFRMLRRAISLSLVAIVWYSIDDWDGIYRDIFDEKKGLWFTLAACLKRNWMQTLLHIAITCVWILPVIASSIWTRLSYAVASGVLHVILSAWFNFAWVNGQLIPGDKMWGGNGIDGGPLGFLTWSIPAIAGTWAYDVIRQARSAPAAQGHPLLPAIGKMVVAGWVVALLGWVLSCPTTIYDVPEDQVAALKDKKFGENPVLPSKEQIAAWDRKLPEPPFVPPPDTDHRKLNYWMMSQRSGSVSYPTFAAGFALMLMGIFVWICDVLGIRIGVFRTLGVNALAGYMLPTLVAPWTRKWAGAWFNALNDKGELTKDAEWLPVAVAFGLMCLIIYLILRLMEWRKIYIRM